MNSHEIVITFETQNEAKTIIKNYETEVKSDSDSLEIIAPKLFKTAVVAQSKEFHIDLIKRNTNDIVIYCYGTKYPTLSLYDVFKGLKNSSVRCIKLKTFYDDGGKEAQYIVNGENCSMQKYNGAYKKLKIEDSALKKAKKTKKVKPKQAIKKESEKNNGSNEKQIKLLESLDYGKDKACKTAIVRMLIRGKSKRNGVRDVFEKALSIAPMDSLSKFSDSFEGLVGSESLIVSWCKYKKSEDGPWINGPENLIFGIKFVEEQNNYLYLGFDLESIEIHDGRPIDKDLRSLILILDSIDGVNRTWIKYRPGQNTIVERYIYYPNGSRAPHVVLNDLTEDNLWPIN